MRLLYRCAFSALHLVSFSFPLCHEGRGKTTLEAVTCPHLNQPLLSPQWSCVYFVDHLTGAWTYGHHSLFSAEASIGMLRTQLQGLRRVSGLPGRLSTKQYAIRT